MLYCYAYSSVSICETIHAMKSGENIELSVQHLLDSILATGALRGIFLMGIVYVPCSIYKAMDYPWKRTIQMSSGAETVPGAYESG